MLAVTSSLISAERTWASAVRSASRPRSVRIASLSESRVSKLPTSFAKASSSGGNSWVLISCKVTRTRRVCPRRASSAWSSGNRTSASTVSPGVRPMIFSSRSGTAWFCPRTMLWGLDSPTLSPSIGATSMRTMCPGAGLPPSTGIQLAFRSRIRSSCSVIAASSTLGTARVKLNPPVLPRVISGRTSTTSSNSTGPPCSNLRFLTEGSEMGLSPWVLWASSQLSRITSSRTACLMAWSNFFRTMATGALPGRNPGRRARLAYMATALSSACLTRSTPTVT